jgi:hypothetical protein
MGPLTRELLRLKPTAAPVDMSLDDAYHFRTIVPAFTFDFLVVVHSNIAATVAKARSGFSLTVAQSVVTATAKLAASNLEADTLTVLEHQVASGTAFDRVVLLPPKIANCFVNQSDVLQAACSWVFPAYAGEFSSGMRGKDFEWRISNKNRERVEMWCWDRPRQ